SVKACLRIQLMLSGIYSSGSPATIQVWSVSMKQLFREWSEGRAVFRVRERGSAGADTFGSDRGVSRPQRDCRPTCQVPVGSIVVSLRAPHRGSRLPGSTATADEHREAIREDPLEGSYRLD